MNIPLHATPGFNFKAEVSYVASHYGVTARALRSARTHNSAQLIEARHALMWRLRHKLGLDERRIARLLDCKAQTAREGIAQHAARIAHYQQTIGFTPRQKGGKHHGEPDTRVLTGRDRDPAG